MRPQLDRRANNARGGRSAGKDYCRELYQYHRRTERRGQERRHAVRKEKGVLGEVDHFQFSGLRDGRGRQGGLRLLLGGLRDGRIFARTLHPYGKDSGDHFFTRFVCFVQFFERAMKSVVDQWHLWVLEKLDKTELRGLFSGFGNSPMLSAQSSHIHASEGPLKGPETSFGGGRDVPDATTRSFTH